MIAGSIKNLSCIQEFFITPLLYIAATAEHSAEAELHSSYNIYTYIYIYVYNIIICIDR